MRKVITKALLTIANVITVTLFVNPTPANAQECTYCFPSCSEVDSRMVSMVGGDENSFNNLSYYFYFTVPEEYTQFDLEIFDGDTGMDENGNYVTWWTGNWDRELLPAIRYSLYTNPDTDYNEDTLVAEWLGNGSNPTSGPGWISDNAVMPNNAWWKATIQTTSNAQTSSGDYYYILKTEFTAVPPMGVSAFKIRSDAPFFTNQRVIGVIATAITMNDFLLIYPEFAGDWLNPGPSIYNGDFYIYFDQYTTQDDFTVWEGDTDFGSDVNGTLDTDDPDTSNTVLPVWAIGANNESAVGEGAPRDDSDWILGARPPSVIFSVISPDNQIFMNNNPSGNTEWEQFKISTDPYNPSTMDYHTGSLLPGIYTMKYEGLDIYNTTFIRGQHKILCEDEYGNPCPIRRPYTIGALVWEDINNSGTRESTEPLFQNVVIDLLDEEGNTIDSTTTNNDGIFYFEVEGQTRDLYSNEILYSGNYTAIIGDSNFDPGGILHGYTRTAGALPIPFHVTDESIFDGEIGYYRPVLPATGSSIVNGFLFGLSVLLISLKKFWPNS